MKLSRRSDHSKRDPERTTLLLFFFLIPRVTYLREVEDDLGCSLQPPDFGPKKTKPQTSVEIWGFW